MNICIGYAPAARKLMLRHIAEDNGERVCKTVSGGGEEIWYDGGGSSV